jgi:hypothetical protein
MRRRERPARGVHLVGRAGGDDQPVEIEDLQRSEGEEEQDHQDERRRHAERRTARVTAQLPQHGEGRGLVAGLAGHDGRPQRTVRAEQHGHAAHERGERQRGHHHLREEARPAGAPLRRAATEEQREHEQRRHAQQERRYQADEAVDQVQMPGVVEAGDAQRRDTDEQPRRERQQEPLAAAAERAQAADAERGQERRADRDDRAQHRRHPRVEQDARGGRPQRRGVFGREEGRQPRP